MNLSSRNLFLKRGIRTLEHPVQISGNSTQQCKVICIFISNSCPVMSYVISIDTSAVSLRSVNMQRKNKNMIASEIRQS